MKSRSRPIPLFFANSREITLKFANFSPKITKNSENCHSRNSQFTQMVKREFTYMNQANQVISCDISCANIRRPRSQFLLKIYLIIWDASSLPCAALLPATLPFNRKFLEMASFRMGAHFLLTYDLIQRTYRSVTIRNVAISIQQQVQRFWEAGFRSTLQWQNSVCRKHLVATQNQRRRWTPNRHQ